MIKRIEEDRERVRSTQGHEAKWSFVRNRGEGHWLTVLRWAVC